ncbi:MAG TPA: hypothetical protein VF234_00170 [Limnochordia bacterium]
MGAAAIEQILRLVPGVRAARVVVEPSGEIAEVHVLSSAARHPKRLVRDIESCLLAHFGQSVDYRRISVAEVADEPKASFRLTVEAIHVTLHPRGAEAKVELKWGHQALSGTAAGPLGERHRLWLLGRATLAALDEILPDHYSTYLVAADAVRVHGRSAAVALVGFCGPHSEEVLCGSAYVQRDEGEAAVKATLAALHRRLEPLLEDVSPEG